MFQRITLGKRLAAILLSLARPASPVFQTASSPNSLPSSHGEKLKEGAFILHNRFGRGKVLRIEGTGDSTKATVQFENVGTKQLLLKFAKFEVIN